MYALTKTEHLIVRILCAALYVLDVVFFFTVAALPSALDHIGLDAIKAIVSVVGGLIAVFSIIMGLLAVTEASTLSDDQEVIVKLKWAQIGLGAALGTVLGTTWTLTTITTYSCLYRYAALKCIIAVIKVVQAVSTLLDEWKPPGRPTIWTHLATTTSLGLFDLAMLVAEFHSEQRSSASAMVGFIGNMLAVVHCPAMYWQRAVALQDQRVSSDRAR